MNAGYVRLSRDDDKRNYVSIENQKLIINQYASDHGMVIDRWYEDDGVSGYIFDRPGFQQMMADLDKDIDTVYVKDFSRLGRHNAKVLLLLDEFQERGKHLIVIDDNYDSFDYSDDTIGIKTWFNERYVKDTSKKIKTRFTNLPSFFIADLFITANSYSLYNKNPTLPMILRIRRLLMVYLCVS